AARLASAVRPAGAGGARPRLRQRPLPARQRLVAARPRPFGRRYPAGGDPLRHAPRQPARPDEPALRRHRRPAAAGTARGTAQRPRNTHLPSATVLRPLAGAAPAADAGLLRPGASGAGAGRLAVPPDGPPRLLGLRAAGDAGLFRLR